MRSPTVTGARRRERAAASLARLPAAGGGGTPLTPWLLAQRLKRGKEHGARAGRAARPTRLRAADGPLVWLHAASVGELASVLPLIERIAQRGIGVLVTTGTVTSGGLAEQRLPRGRDPSIRAARRAALRAPLPRPLAAGPRAVRGIRPVAEHDHRGLAARRADDPGQRARCRKIPTGAGPICAAASATCCAASIYASPARRPTPCGWTRSARRASSPPAISSSTCRRRRPMRPSSRPCSRRSPAAR